MWIWVAAAGRPGACAPLLHPSITCRRPQAWLACLLACLLAASPASQKHDACRQNIHCNLTKPAPISPAPTAIDPAHIRPSPRSLPPSALSVSAALLCSAAARADLRAADSPPFHTIASPPPQLQL